jgi:hypothetical protein
MNILEIYRKWRKQTLPPSINELEWRHYELRARLELIQNYISSSHFAEKNYSSETHSCIINFFSLLKPVNVVGFDKIRVGSTHDGGYVQLNDIEKNKLALSLGINDDDNWDVQIALKGVEVHQFDHTIEASPTIHEKLHFHKKMISNITTEETITLSDLLNPYISTVGPCIILKIDIEGDEWSVLDSTSAQELNTCSQILCEFHNLSQLNNVGFYNLALRVLQKITESFSVIHIHANNCADVFNIANVMVPDVLEVTFANNSIYKFSETNEIFPTELDAPCSPGRPDIFLGAFRFK